MDGSGNANAVVDRHHGIAAAYDSVVSTPVGCLVALRALGGLLKYLSTSGQAFDVDLHPARGRRLPGLLAVV